MKKLILALGILSVMSLSMAACKTNESSVPDNTASVPQASELPGAQVSDDMKVLPRSGQVTDGNGIIGDTDDMIYSGNAVDNAGDTAENAARNIGDTIDNAADNAGSAASNITSNAGDVVSNITSNAGDVVSNVTSNVGDTISNIADNAGNTVENAADNLSASGAD